MEEIITSTHEILKLDNRFGWNTFQTDNLLTIFKFASRYGLQLSLLPFGDKSDQFRLTTADSTAERPTNVYFQPDQFGCIVAFIDVLSEAGLIEQSSSLSEKLSQLEKRVAALEGRPQEAHPPPLSVCDTTSETNPQGDGLTLEAKIKVLNERAKKIDNYVYLENRRIVYRRERRKHPYGQRWQVYFTIEDAYQPTRKHRYSKWYFDEDELDELEQTLQHDEDLYRQAHDESWDES